MPKAIAYYLMAAILALLCAFAIVVGVHTTAFSVQVLVLHQQHYRDQWRQLMDLAVIGLTIALTIYLGNFMRTHGLTKGLKLSIAIILGGAGVYLVNREAYFVFPHEAQVVSPQP